jgi:hypothetical protein
VLTVLTPLSAEFDWLPPRQIAALALLTVGSYVAHENYRYFPPALLNYKSEALSSHNEGRLFEPLHIDLIGCGKGRANNTSRK